MAFLFFFTLGGVCLGSNLIPGAEATPFIKDFIIAFFIFYLSSFLLVCTSARSRSHLWSSLRGVCSCAWTMLLRARACVLDETLLESDDVVLYIVLKDFFSLSFLAPGLPQLRPRTVCTVASVVWKVRPFERTGHVIVIEACWVKCLRFHSVKFWKATNHAKCE